MHRRRNGNWRLDPLDHHELNDLVSRLEGCSRTKRFAVVSAGLHDFLVRRSVTYSHDIFSDDAISGFHNERIYVALAWGSLPLAKVGAFRLVAAQFRVATIPRSMVSLNCDSPLYRRFWIASTVPSAV